MKVKVVDKDYTRDFLREHKSNKRRALWTVGGFLDGEVKDRSPVDQGFLKRSNRFRVDGDELLLENTAPYAEYLEYGTRKMAPQSFQEPAVLDNLLEIDELLRRSL